MSLRYYLFTTILIVILTLTISWWKQKQEGREILWIMIKVISVLAVLSAVWSSDFLTAFAVVVRSPSNVGSIADAISYSGGVGQLILKGSGWVVMSLSAWR